MADIRVEVDGAMQEELDGIERAFRGAGLNTRPEPPRTETRSVELPPTWIIEVYVFWKILQPFFDSFLTEAGKDSYAAFKQCVQELFGTFAERPGFIRVTRMARSSRSPPNPGRSPRSAARHRLESAASR